MLDAWHLHKFDWMESLPTADLEALRNASAKCTYQTREIVFAPSREPHSVYLLELGRVRIYRVSPTGSETTFGFVSPGEVFGELAAFGDYPRESYAEAAAPSTVLKIDKGVFQSVVSHSPGLVIEVARQIGDRFKRIESRVENLVFSRVRTRVARILLELAEDFGRQEEEGTGFDITLSQSDLATLVGATRQTVNAALQELDQEGLIAVRGQRIVLLEPALLRENAERPGRT